MAFHFRSAARRVGTRLLALALLLAAPVSAGAETQTGARPPLCAIDMGSNSFKRMVGSFENGRYLQRSFEKKTLGVGDDLSRHGRISDAKLAEIERTLVAFQAACAKESAARALAIGTAAFREAPNGPRVAETAAKLGISMEIASERRESELAYLVGSLGQPGVAQLAAGRLRDQLDAAAAVVDHRVFMKGQRRLVGVEFEEMAQVLFEPAETEGRVLRLEELRRRLDEIEALRGPVLEALVRKPDIDRALPRLVVAATLTEAFGYSALELTARELGTGLIIEAGLRP